MVKRTDRLNSLLKEVISDVVRLQVKHPHVSKFLTITRVDITRDLRHAKVYVSVIGEDKARNETLEALNQAAGFIAITASKQV
ncbi:MAG: 30S ribosome-binding factor RbfA, partial [Chlamydiia bacterium]|nr:30S ribosome-binding factor RbfA [Chlamydiia bacterium]